MSEPDTIVSIARGKATIETVDPDLQKKLRRMGFEPGVVEGDDDDDVLEVFDVPSTAVEISTRGITRAERIAALTPKERKALGQRLQQGKAAAKSTSRRRR